MLILPCHCFAFHREVDVGKTLSETEWIGMCRREVMDDFLRNRAKKLGANIINGLFMKMEDKGDAGITIQYNSYEDGSKMGSPQSLDVSTQHKCNGATLQLKHLRLGGQTERFSHPFPVAILVFDIALWVMRARLNAYGIV